MRHVLIAIAASAILTAVIPGSASAQSYGYCYGPWAAPTGFTGPFPVAARFHIGYDTERDRELQEARGQRELEAVLLEHFSQVPSLQLSITSIDNSYVIDYILLSRGSDSEGRAQAYWAAVALMLPDNKLFFRFETSKQFPEDFDRIMPEAVSTLANFLVNGWTC